MNLPKTKDMYLFTNFNFPWWCPWTMSSRKFKTWELPWFIVTVNFNLTSDNYQCFVPYQCLVCRSREPAVVMNPLVHSRGMVTNPLNDLIHIDDVCGLYTERPREGNICLTTSILPEIVEPAFEENNFLSFIRNGMCQGKEMHFSLMVGKENVTKEVLSNLQNKAFVSQYF